MLKVGDGENNFFIIYKCCFHSERFPESHVGRRIPHHDGFFKTNFLCDVGDDYKVIAMKVNQVSEEKFNEVRNTKLKIAQTLIQQIRKEFSEDPDFDEINERIELLDR